MSSNVRAVDVDPKSASRGFQFRSIAANTIETGLTPNSRRIDKSSRSRSAPSKNAVAHRRLYNSETGRASGDATPRDTPRFSQLSAGHALNGSGAYLERI